MELLDAILVVTKCESADELKNLSSERKLLLAKSLEERVPSGLAPIEEWNELLMIFMSGPPADDNKVAKKRLISYLRSQEYNDEATDNTKKCCKSKLDK